MIEFLITAYKLKDEKRAGWVLREIKDPESVADHSWGTAVLCWLYGSGAAGTSNDIDTNRAVLMALIHDVAEAEIGDIATRVHVEDQTVSPEEKRYRERIAMSRLAAILPVENRQEELISLWAEYEEGRSWTARFVRDMNLCDMCLQALVYEQQRRYTIPEVDSNTRFERLDEFFATSRPRISTQTGARLHGEIERRYIALKRQTR